MTRLVVDAMNVIGSRPDGWWRDRGGAASRLLARLEALAATGQDVTLVVDGRPGPGWPAPGAGGAVEVVYAGRRGRDAADDRIVELVAAGDDPGALEVVTADRALAGRVRALGAATSSPSALLARLDALA